jgi:hypothetical protein
MWSKAQVRCQPPLLRMPTTERFRPERVVGLRVVTHTELNRAVRAAAQNPEPSFTPGNRVTIK